MALNLSEEDIKNPNELGCKLVTLAEIIVRKHFYASWSEKDDLVSVGVLKALSLIEAGNWTKGRGSFLNYIYSGMRNDIHNYLYHLNKEVVMGEEYPEGMHKDNYFEEEACYMDYRIIHVVCLGFEKAFGSGLESRIIAEVQKMGFIVRGMDSNIHTLKVFTGGCWDKEGGESDRDEIVGRVLGIIFWKVRECDI